MQVKHDRKLLIAIGRSRKASQWQNKEMLWSEFLDKLATTTRTRETVTEYAAMSKADRDTIKDVGGFVGGYLKNGKRNNASVINRCMLCLDADNADPGLMDDLDMMFINAYALYSTHSHTPEKMRLRLIIPLTRTVTPDEYAAVARRVADDLNLKRFDPTTFEPARLMYWPSTPEDGEFFFRYADEPFLDPDGVLNTYADWKDASLWPTTSLWRNASVTLPASRKIPPRSSASSAPSVVLIPLPMCWSIFSPTAIRPPSRTTASLLSAAAPRAAWLSTATNTPFRITPPTLQAASCAMPLIWCAGICSCRVARPRTVLLLGTTHGHRNFGARTASNESG